MERLASLFSETIRAAITFGAHVVILPTRHRVIIEGDVVVTVHPSSRAGLPNCYKQERGRHA